MKSQTLKRIINAFHAVSIDTARHSLNHVILRRDDTLEAVPHCVRIIACNGHMLSEVTLSDENLHSLMEQETDYALHNSLLPALKALYKTMGENVPASLDGDSLVFSDTGSSVAAGLKITIPTAKDASVTYPDLNQVKPKLTGEETEIGLNPELLRLLMKALRGGKKAGVKLIIKDKASPITVVVDEQRGLLMPMRL